MKLSTRSRYGTRFMLELARCYGKGFVQLGDIARVQAISVKYLEQIVIPLRRSRYVEGVRGAKGGYRLARPPEEISVGEIVGLLEQGMSLTECSEKPAVCDRSDDCLTRDLWREAAEAMYRHLNAVTLADLLKKEKTPPPKGNRKQRKVVQRLSGSFKDRGRGES